MAVNTHSLPACTTIQTRQFWMASLAASWQGVRLKIGPDLSELDWPWLLAAGDYHRILPDFHYTWSLFQGLPAFVQDALWMSHNRAKYKGALVHQGISDLQKVAGKRNVRMALLKSPTYAMEAFEGFERREINDIDILVSDKDMPIIKRELLELGYQTEQRIRQHKGGECLFFKDKLLIEVHKTASNRRRFQRLLSTEDLLRRAVGTQLFLPLLRLSDADEALIMVLHAYHHGWREALWIRDLAAWWRIRNPDPDKILETFRAVNLLRTGWMAWAGISSIGWRLPKAWNRQMWASNESFDRQIRVFWQQCLERIGLSRELCFRRRHLEVVQAQDLCSKLSALSPMFSWRFMLELWQAR